MIAKGNPHNSPTYLAWYLAAPSKGTERADLAELRGFASDNIFDALALVELQGQGTSCQKPIFHVQVRLPKEENLARGLWLYVANRIERKLGFDGQPRAIVFHEKEGQEHMHIAWSRLDENLHPIDPGLYKLKLKEVCRAVEKEMGLVQVKNERDPGERTQPANRGEYEEARRLKTDLKAIREDIRDCWDMTRDGASFTAALEAKGYILARGDERAFVVIDEKGGKHALSKRITGVTLPKMKIRLSDIDSAGLPGIDQAKAMQRERQLKAEQEAKIIMEEPIIEEEERKKEIVRQQEEEKREVIRKDEDQKTQAIKESEDQKQKAILEEEDRKQQAIREEEQKKQEAIKETALKEEQARRDPYKVQADRLVEQAKDMERQEAYLKAYQAELTRQAEEARRQTELTRQARETAEARELEIRNPNYRYGEALGQHYDIRDPYGSLARASMAEYGSFLRDRGSIEHQIAQAKDPATRKSLELRRDIEAAEYMAITSDRIAVQSEIIVGRRNTDEAMKQRERAIAFRKEAQGLREQYRELQMSRVQASEPAKMQTRPAPAREVSPERGYAPDPPARPAHYATPPPREPERVQSVQRTAAPAQPVTRQVTPPPRPEPEQVKPRTSEEQQKRPQQTHYERESAERDALRARHGIDQQTRSGRESGREQTEYQKEKAARDAMRERLDARQGRTTRPQERDERAKTRDDGGGGREQ